MRVPQVSERVKEAPAHALRAVFAGIGQVLLVADRMRNRPQDTKPAAPASSPGQSPAPTAAVPAPAAAAPVADTRPEAADVPADQPPEPTQPPAPTEAPAASAASAAGALPLANYDELTVASLRARMRVLDPAQLRTLIDYERSHAGRADVVAMFERRITKIGSGDSGLAG
jgi:hypothetical protein